MASYQMILFFQRSGNRRKPCKTLSEDLMRFLYGLNRDEWPAHFRQFLEEQYRRNFRNVDEYFASLEDSEAIFREIIYQEIFGLTEETRFQIFSVRCCHEEGHNDDCAEFWNNFVFLLQNFILNTSN